MSEPPRNSPGVDVVVFLERSAMDKLKELFAQVTYLHEECVEQALRSLRTLSDSERRPSMDETTRRNILSSPIMSSRFLFGFALLFSTALATSDTCTVFQIHTTIQGLDDVLSSGKCATTCHQLVPVKELASKLPDCALSDNGNSVNKKRELQNGLEDCSAESSASLNVERSGHECSIADASTTADLYLEAASSPACGEYVAMDESTMTVFIYAPCSATQCVAVMETMVEQLPDCYTDGVNVKQDVLQSLTSCIGSSSAAGASQPNSGGECTDDEVSSLAYLTNSIVAT
ncbi:hypothetical protein GQ600_5719 [Phytophthora cactorum]|nr:hypothetical protein GQ600_5719 [Phytophthora cactorum]